MSRIPDLGKQLEKIPEVLEEYEIALEGVEDIIEIKGKKLEHANRENAPWQHYYDQKKLELKSIVDWLEARVNSTRGRLFKNLTEGAPRDLSDRAKDKYIDNEKAYLDMYELYLEAKELYSKYSATVDAFTARGYALNNITKIRVASLEDVEL